MALFELNSLVSIDSSVIGQFQFSGVHEVRIKKSIHSIIETATLIIPSIAKYITKNKSMPVSVTTGLQFTDGDPITIQLGYNGQYQTEFVGFVKRRDLAMPLEVECEGYVRQLRLNTNISGHYKSITAKALLELACAGTDIKVQCDIDFNLTGIRLPNLSGARICDVIKEASDHTLTIFFITPTTLWCGLTYTAYSAQATANIFNLPTVNYRLGYNTPKDNALKERVPSEPVQVIMQGKLATGNLLYTASKMKSAKQKVQSLQNHIGDNTTLGMFAQEKEYNLNYTGFEGKLTGFLQPYALPGYDANINDVRYPELKGTYLIESTDVSFGIKGARRVCEIGPRVGFGSLKNIN